MKKYLLLTLTFLLLSGRLSYVVNAAEEVKVLLDGELIYFDVPAQIIDGRTMVPVRKIFEKLGMSVDWNNETKIVSAHKPGIIIKLPIDSYTVYRNTVEQNIDAPARIIDGRTLVPVRVVSEYAGADVYWDGDTNTVRINSTENIKYIDWNDNFYYYGEAENGIAEGYGILYSKNDDTISQSGKYINSQIVIGSDFFDNGDVYVGNYADSKFSYGTYHYANGDSYTGEFQDNQRSGNGTYYCVNGNFHKGKWEDGLPNGYGIFYDATENVQYQGNYVNGNPEGSFVIDDFFENKTYSIIYSGIAEMEEYYKKVDELEREYAELNSWYGEKLSELYDYIKTGNPFSTDWAKSIYESYGITDGSSLADSNLDSFAAANAKRQQAALKSQADAVILEYNETYISQQKQLIEDTYNLKKEQLDKQKQSLEMEKVKLGL